MATRNLKTKLELDGEKEYKQALSEINSGLKVLNSEMKLTSARFEGNADSVEALTAKNDVLNRQILSQKEKVEKLREALQKSAQVNGEADKKTNDWKISLNNAEKELLKLDKELKENEEALKKSTKAADGGKNGLDKFGSALESSSGKSRGLGEVIDGLAGKLGINLPDGMKNSLDSFMKLNGNVAIVAGAFAALGAAIYGVEQKLANLTLTQAAAADEIITASYVTGMSTDAIQEYRYAAELMDVSFETLTSSQSKMIRTMGDARRGTEKAQEAFFKLGVEYKDVNGELRDSQEVFYEVIDALGRIYNETERDAISMDIFGRSARELNPLIVQGSRVLKEYAQEAQDTGYVLSTDMLDALGAVDDSYQRLKNSQENAKNQIALQFAPALEKFYESAGEGIRTLGEALARSGIVDLFASILEIVSALEPAFSTLGIALGPFLSMLKPVALVLSAIADALRIISDVVGGVIGLFTGNSGKYWDDLGSLFAGNSATKRTWNNLLGSNASGTDNWRGGATWVGEHGPELVYLPQGTQIQTAQESRIGGDVYHITIPASDIREFNDIVRIAQNQRRTARMGYAGG